MKKLLNLFQWLDDNILKLFVIAFIFINPLIPKFPFIDLEYTYISIRVEDFFVVLMSVIFAIQLLRKKLQINKQFLLLFVLFWAAVFASFAWNHYMNTTVPVWNIGFLHAARRVEYMIVFLITLSTIRSKNDFHLYLKLIVGALLIVSLYGIGQKFLGFPAVQTMNPEFARGHILYLTPEARISSSFAGHYDFAAYLVLLLPITLSLYIWKRNVLYFLIFFFALFALALTASRISTGAYAVSMLAMLVFMRKWLLLVIVIILSVGLSMFSTNLTSRFMKTFQVRQVFVNEQTGQVVVPQAGPDSLPAGSYIVPVKQKETTEVPVVKDPTALKEALLKDVREDAKKAGKTLTAAQEDKLVATKTATLKPVNTVVSDISFATRLQVEWPRAIDAFKANPLLGTGPSSITEATDNDYLRWIGETGALGTLLFLAILFMIAKTVFFKTLTLPKDDQTIYYGFLFGMAGLMMNASYIDVFEASKVAFQFWLTAAIFVGSILIMKKGKV